MCVIGEAALISMLRNLCIKLVDVLLTWVAII